MTDNGNDCRRLGVSHPLRNFVGMRLFLNFTSLLVYLFGFPLHSHTEYGSLRLGSALSAPGFLRFVLVGFTSTKVHFVTLHNTRKDNIIVLFEESTHLMQNEPSGFLRYGDIRSQLNGGNAFLVAGDKIHGEKPLHKRNLGILEDSTYGNGEVRLAVAAMESSVSTADAMVLPAERTYNVILVPTGLKDSLATLVLGVEVRSEFVYAVELAEVNHKSQA